MRLHNLLSSVSFAVALLSSLPSHAIIRGSLAESDSYKSTILIYNDTNTNICTGVIVHPRLVLTAGHCILGFRKESLRFSASSQFNQARARALKILKMEVPSAYQGAFNGIQDSSATSNDVAYIHFGEDATSSLGVSNTDLPYIASTKEKFEIASTQKSEFELVGYGLNSKSKDADISKTNRRRYSLTAASTDEGLTLRAKSVNSDQSSCVGDSGGPFFAVDSAGRKTLLGVLSSIIAGGELAKRHEKFKANLLKKAKEKLDKQLAGDLKKGITVERELEKVAIPQNMRLQACGDKDTIQRVASLYPHLCWIQKATGLTLDPNLKCNGDL